MDKPVSQALPEGSGERYVESNRLRERAHALIPGGAHTYAKGDDQYPILAPGFIARGQGSHVWDVDGNEYIEFGMGNRAVGLGHAYPAVVDAVKQELSRGCNFTRPAPIELKCAEQFLRMIPADMVKFCKDGSTATTEALRLARAVTGRDYVACCQNHPFFATHDWFIGLTSMNAGIPGAVTDLTLSFRYNDIASLREMFAQYPGKIAAVILEPAKEVEPKDDFLALAKQIAHENGALFIFDEMITGFRWDNGGAQKVYGVTPDLCCFGKALGNGFSVSALAGKREFMEHGGYEHGRERVFLLSTTHGGETHALAAAIANMRVYETEPVVDHLYRVGGRLKDGISEVIRRHGLERYLSVEGRPCCLIYIARDGEGQSNQAFRSLLLQETIKRGVIMPSLVVSYTHSDSDIDRTVDAWDGALEVYKRAIEDGVEHYLVGRPSNPVFRRLR